MSAPHRDRSLINRFLSDCSLSEQYRPKHAFGQNWSGGSTWLGHQRDSHQPVIIQEYRLPQHYRTQILQDYQRRAETLQQLEHPRVPSYRDAAVAMPEPEGYSRLDRSHGVHSQIHSQVHSQSLSKAQAFCTVQTLPKAKPLLRWQEPSPVLLQAVARRSLRILKTLQQQQPELVHGAINPDNLWLSERQRVYLMNFALDLHPRPQERSATGFLAPEQCHRRNLHPSTDLYSLGLTLIAWATGMGGEQLLQLRNAHGQLGFQRFMPVQYSVELIRWLDTLVQPEHRDRFPDAATALTALLEITAERQPKLQLKPKSLLFNARQVGEQLQQTITLENPVPDTVLKGHWEIAEGDRAWLQVEPRRFSGNRVQCRISVDTRHLRSQQALTRQLQLKTNAESPALALPLRIKTAGFQAQHLPWPGLLLLAGLSLLLSQGVTPMVHEFRLLGWGFWGVGAALGGYVGWAIACSKTDVIARACLLTACIGGAIGTQATTTLNIVETGLLNYVVGVGCGGLLLGAATGCARQHRRQGFLSSVAVAVPLLTLIVSFLGGVGYRLSGLPPRLELGGYWLAGLLALLVAGIESRELLRWGRHLWRQRRLIGPSDTNDTGDTGNTRGSDTGTVQRSQPRGRKHNAGGATTGYVVAGEHRGTGRRKNRTRSQSVGGHYRQ